MTLTLRAMSLDEQPLTQPITAHFDLKGGTIGRADHNTMALPDPERFISRQQAEISAGAAGYFIKNVGSANPIAVRGAQLAQGESVPLKHGDQVRIGGYLLEVIDDAATDIEAASITLGRAAVDALTAGLPPPAGIPKESAAWARPAMAMPRLPDDFDAFSTPRLATSEPPAPAPAGGAFDDLIPNAAPTSIDELFGLSLAGKGDLLADFMAGPAAAPAPLPSAATAGDHAPEWHAAFRPPAIVASAAPPRREREAPPPAVPPAAPRPAPAPAAWKGSTRELWQAFCEGAGIRLELPQGLDPELMRVMGALLRSSVEGTLQLVAVRAATKHELRAQVTVIQARGNNPLKFSPDAQSALEQMLQPPVRGFLPGPAAMTDAMQDLVGHAIGTMAGTRAALEGVLGRFRPRELESRLAGASMIDSVLPMNRKAKLWELYLQHFEHIREQAQDDFHNLFGKAFLAAYEQQLERLRREKTPSPAN